jgi:aldehyde:ferredoxin oxidoreductase
MLDKDTLAKVLYVDLSKRKHWVERREDLFDKYLGGAGTAIKLLEENCPQGTDPLSPQNPIILATGPLCGLFPLASKTVAMFKSPHTGNLGESHAGGRSSVALRMAGYGALVILGGNDKPGYLAVHGDKVYYRDARALWGMGSSFTVGRVIRENEPGPGLRSIMRIGRAGENLVTYSAVTTESYRHFGRLGLGAVFGAKRLKAVVVSGQRALPVADLKEYRELYEEIHRAAVESPAMKKYHDLGTPENLRPLNKIGALPLRNLASASDDRADAISGEKMAEGYLGRRLACTHCPVGCIHIAALREPYEREAFFYKTSMISYDYEPTYSLGTMLGVFDPAGLLKLLDTVEKVGLDSMSAGVALAWATEAFEKKLIGESETDGVKMAWGDVAAYRQAIGRIVSRSNEFYKILGRGVAAASERYGGKEFALAFGGNEMPGYHTGPGAHLGCLFGARHSHLDNAGYSVDQKNLGKEPVPPEKLASSLAAEEEWRQVLSSLVLCFFSRGLYPAETVARALKTCGYELGADQLKELGRKVLRNKYAFKVREGFDPRPEALPDRIYQTPAPGGAIDRGYMAEAAKAYRRELGLKP